MKENPRMRSVLPTTHLKLLFKWILSWNFCQWFFFQTQTSLAPRANFTYTRTGQEPSGGPLRRYSFCVSGFESDAGLLLNRSGNKSALGSQRTLGTQNSTPSWVGPWPPSSLSACISSTCPWSWSKWIMIYFCCCLREALESHSETRVQKSNLCLILV